MINVRFAPSPTGLLHIGGARTALFNYLFAKKNNGNFFLRIEDTDKIRSKDLYVKSIIESLNWLNIKHDGEIVYQSKNKDIYIKYAEKLLLNNMAYRCSCEETNHSTTIKHRHLCKGYGDKYAIRIKSPENTIIKFHDLVRGEISINSNEINDFVIVRSNREPIYQFCAPIDDHEMNITHIIRGDDHITNTFGQILIYNSLNLKIPIFAHIPLIHAPNGEKMSKRHGAVDTIEYKNIGILSGALKNYLFKLGMPNVEDDTMSDEQMIENISISDIGKSPTRFDMKKLLNINHQHIQKTNEQELMSIFNELFINKFNTTLSQTQLNRISLGIKSLKEKSDTVLDMIENGMFYLKDDFTIENIETINKTALKETLKAILKLKKWNQESIQYIFKNTSESENFSKKEIMQSIRLSLTGTLKSPNITEIMIALGKDECIKRIEKLI